MADRLIFGTAGIPSSSRLQTTESGIRAAAELGLGCMEVQFTKGLRMSESTARQAAQVARNTGIKLSAHAPYSINLNAHEGEKLIASRDKLLRTAHLASLLGATGVVFHAAHYLGDPAPTVYSRVKEALINIVNLLKQDRIHVLLMPESTGKLSQFGTIEEVLSLGAEIDGIFPCIDFAHCHARGRKYNSYAEFSNLLAKIEKKLGSQALRQMHIHISGIEYDVRGEIRHVNLQHSDLSYLELLQALKDNDVAGRIICESPDPERDAILLKNYYRML